MYFDPSSPTAAPRRQSRVPSYGRFVQPDPIGYGDGMNPYAYVAGDPVNLIDPTGLSEDVNCTTNPDQCDTVTGTRFCPDGAICYYGGIGGGGGGLGNIRSGDDHREGLPLQEPTECHGPPPGPVGVTAAQMASQARQNAREARRHGSFYPFSNALWFRNQVRNGGPMDYKQYDRGFRAFGNYNYGYVGAEIFGLNFLLRMAGSAQIAAGTSRPEWGTPSSGPPYGDDPADQRHIRNGYYDNRNGC